jgi:hypothetical protein
MWKEAVAIVLVILILAFTLGLVLVGSGDISPKYQAGMEALRLDTAAKMRWIKIGFWGGLTAIALVGLAGMVGGLLRVMWQRSRLIHPHPTGLFPIVEGQTGAQTYYHDPNRQWAGTTIYEAGPEGATARHLIPPNQEETQFQIATQAQATQFVAAASQGRGLTAPARRLAERVVLAAAERPVPRLPQVVVLNESVPEERRLLAALQQDWVEGEGGE